MEEPIKKELSDRSKSKVSLTDEEVDRILQAEVKKRAAGNPQTCETKEVSLWSKIKKVEDLLDRKTEEFFDRTIHKLPEIYSTYVFEKIKNRTNKKKENPEVMEFVYSLLSGFQILNYILLIFPGGIILRVLMKNYDDMFLDAFIITSAFLIIGGIGFEVILFLGGIIYNRMLVGLFVDKLTKKKIVKKNVNILSIFVRHTSDSFSRENDSIIYYFYPEEYATFAVAMFYQELESNVAPKSSSPQRPFNLYEQDYVPTPYKKKSVNWIMTKQKSDLLDELIRLEPTAEFEIRYLKYSKSLQEIRPIEGWEYAEGVPELCEKISKMYP